VDGMESRKVAWLFDSVFDPVDSHGSISRFVLFKRSELQWILGSNSPFGVPKSVPVDC
jgi:hypothetical protein